MESLQNNIGYVKYEGLSVEDGYLDARKSAEILIGIDHVFRYFLYQQDPKLQELDFEVPVKIRKGSWEALVPGDIETWLKTAGSIALIKYLTTAVTEIAKNDVGDKGVKDILKSVFKSIVWVLKIAKHTGSLVIKQFTNAKIVEHENEILIGIENEKKEVLLVPKIYLEQYQNCPEKLFSKLAKVVDMDRDLSVGISEDKTDENNVTITYAYKFIFTGKEDDKNFLFPELEHGTYIELEGHITRGNENANSIGFEYLRHVLTCYPIQGNIKDYKSLLFTNCLIKGYIDRQDDFGNISEKKPKIRFLTLDELKKVGAQIGLF